MIRNAYFLFLWLATSSMSHLFGQTNKLLNRDSIELMRLTGSSVVTILTDKSRNAKFEYYYFKDGLKTDSTNLWIANNVQNKLDGDFVYYINDGSLLYYKISSTGVVTQFLKTMTRYHCVLGDKMIGVDQNSYEKVEREEEFGVSGGMKPNEELLRTIAAFNFTTGEKSFLLSLDSLSIPSEEDVIEIFASPNSAKILITTGIYESGDQRINRVLIMDLQTGKIVQKSMPQLVTDYDRKYREWGLHYFLAFDITGQFILIGEYILSTEFDVVSLSLRRDSDFVQSFLDSGRQFFWVPSELDNNKQWSKGLPHNRVLVQYRITLELESNLYKIYHNVDVNKKELSYMRKDDLNILKNMVFAKHNYKFDSEYYQAVFNLFDFYRDLREKRTKDVNNLLTETDKKNLSVITKLLTKVK